MVKYLIFQSVLGLLSNLMELKKASPKFSRLRLTRCASAINLGLQIKPVNHCDLCLQDPYFFSRRFVEHKIPDCNCDFFYSTLRIRKLRESCISHGRQNAKVPSVGSSKNLLVLRNVKIHKSLFP